MKRYIFDAASVGDEEIIRSGDEKALAAFHTATAMVSDEMKNMTALLLLSFDMGTPGLAFTEIAQFLYDNYTTHQITGLYLSLTSPEKIVAKKRHYESEEEMLELKREAEELALKAENDE
jgi:hypothetical protein